MKEKTDAQLWYIILSCLERHNKFNYDFKEFDFSVKTTEIFPSKPEKFKGYPIYCDEAANRFGLFLIDVTIVVQEFFRLSRLDEKFNTQKDIQAFPSLLDVFTYFKKHLLDLRPDLFKKSG